MTKTIDKLGWEKRKMGGREKSKRTQTKAASRKVWRKWKHMERNWDQKEANQKRGCKMVARRWVWIFPYNYCTWTSQSTHNLRPQLTHQTLKVGLAVWTLQGISGNIRPAVQISGSLPYCISLRMLELLSNYILIKLWSEINFPEIAKQNVVLEHYCIGHHQIIIV